MYIGDTNWYLLCRISEGNITEEVVQSIIDMGAEYDACNPCTEESVLMLLIRLGHDVIAKTFIDHCQYIDYQDKEGKTALMYAAEKHQFELIVMMLARGADIQLKDKKGKDACDYASTTTLKRYFRFKLRQLLKKEEVIEGPFKLYDKEKLENEIDEEESQRRKTYLKRLAETEPTRNFAVACDEVTSALRDLVSKFPNFKPAIDFFEKQLHLSLLSEDKLIEFEPLLIAGPPGIGKTKFCYAIAELFKSYLGVISCGTVSASFVLCGSTPSWSEARPGRIHEIMRDSHVGNPFVLFDELDKFSSENRYNPYGPLYTLLEKNTAKGFVDEMISIPIDHSKINWIASANDLHAIPEAILSRFSVIHLNEPTPEQIKIIADSIYKEILASNSWGHRFVNELNDDVISILANISPRQVRKVLLNGCGKAALGQQGQSIQIVKSDIDVDITNKKTKFGFIH